MAACQSATQHSPYSFITTPHGRAYHVPLSFFLQHVLPPLPHDLDVSKVAESFLDAGKETTAQKPITSKGRWRGFAVDPADAKRSDKKSFTFLQHAVRAISRAAGGKNAAASFHNNPKCIPSNDKRQLSTFPDAYLSHSRQPCHWNDIIAFGEYKKRDTAADIEDNIAKLTGSMSNCMYSDPRRRFVYAFTIENTSMRFWFCDRAQILVSKSFNFITDHKPMVHFFLSLLRAGPENIGLDSTMVQLDEPGRFEITVHSFGGDARVYQTLELLSDSGARSLKSRGTRVWKAIRIENGRESGDPVALKDSWVDPRHSSEGTNLEEICSLHRPEEWHLDDCPLFVTAEWHGDVRLGEGGGILDVTRAFSRYAPPAGTPPKCREDLASPLSSTSTAGPQKPISRHRAHYRIIYKDVCRPFYQETSFSVAFRTLADVAIALGVMHSSGWVHRDVSIGNILVKGADSTLLTDMEYATKVERLDAYHMGTADFMAVEVDYQRYMFRPTETPECCLPERARNGLSLREIRREIQRGVPFSELVSPLPADIFAPCVEPEFHYNPLHDLESLWWIAVYLILKKAAPDDITDGDEQVVEAMDAQKIYAFQLFDEHSYRLTTLEHEVYFMQRIQACHPAFHRAGVLLDTLRRALVDRYRTIEKNLDSADFSCVVPLSHCFAGIFLDIDEEVKGLSFRPWPIRELGDGYDIPASISAPRGTNRPRSEEQLARSPAIDAEAVPSTKKLKVTPGQKWADLPA